MENRFGVKDVFLFLILIALLVSVWLAMSQFDRQFQLVRQTNLKLEEQSGDLARIRRLLEQGAVAVPQTQPTTQNATADSSVDPFARIKKTHANPDYAPGDAIVDTFAVVPDKLTPLVSQDAYGAQVQNYVLDTLADRDPNTLEWIPRLAKSWKISDDQLTIDFELRPGVTFSDGEPLTADDVVFTMEMTLDPKIEAERSRTYLDKLDHVEKLNDYAVRFVFKEPYFKSFETAAGTQVMSKKFYSQFTPAQFNESTGLLIGSGPYKLADPKSWRPEPGKPVEIIRNERYWGELPAFKRLIWKVIENPTARVTSFRNGETDTYAPTPEQYDDMIKDEKLTARTVHFAIDIPNSGYRYIGWNEYLDGKPTRFADPRVRRALTMLTDRETICKDILHGYASVNSGSFSALTPQADPSIKPWPFDPAAAEKLLTEAGYTKKDGVLFDADGKEFRFNLAYNSNSDVGKRIVSFIKDAYARAGIIVEPQPMEWSVLLQRVGKERKFDAVLLGWTGGIEEDPRQIFHSGSIAGTGDNFVHYSNPKLDEAIDRARKIVKDDDRMKVWHEVHQIIHEDQPYTFLFISKDLEFVDNRFRGIEPTKVGLNSILEWYTPKSSQKYSD